MNFEMVVLDTSVSVGMSCFVRLRYSVFVVDVVDVYMSILEIYCLIVLVFLSLLKRNKLP